MNKIFNKTTILATILITLLGTGCVIKAESQKKLQAKEEARQELLEEYKHSPIRHVLKSNPTGEDYSLMCCETIGLTYQDCLKHLAEKKKEMKN